MKIQLYKKSFLYLVPFYSAIVLLAACQNNTKDMYSNKNNTSKSAKNYTDFNEAMEYEFNMIKDPATGMIPIGSFTGELEQARAILANQQQNNTAEFGTPYIFQGPDNLGGRTRTIAYDIRYNGTSNRIILAGGVSGGVYKSTDDGATWVRKSPTGDHFSCTSIAQDTRVGFRDTWYYGVGESIAGSSSLPGALYSGNGVYKSTDNGETWSRLAASNTGALEAYDHLADFVAKVIVDPTNGNVYIACPAAIIRSTDGGTSWEVVLSGPGASSGKMTDIVVTSTGRLYASFAGTNDSSVDGVWASPPGPGSGDLGSWGRIAGLGMGGSPTGWKSEPDYGRVVLGIAPSAEHFLYALYYAGATSTCAAEFPDAHLFRWNDMTGIWTNLSATMPDESGCLEGNDPFASQSGYDLVVAVKPDDASTVFIGGTNAYRSTDAGLTWTRIGGYFSPADYSVYPGSHADIHAFAFQPGSPTIMLCGNDGGIQRTTDNTAVSVAWTPINSGYRTYQYYHVAVDPRSANSKVMGGAQDNGTTRNIGGAGTSFETVYSGDGVSVGLSDPGLGTQFEYVGYQLGYIVRRLETDASGVGTPITPIGKGGSGLFVTKFHLDPDNTEKLYYANAHELFRPTTSASTVLPASWTALTGVAGAVAPSSITALATTRGAYSPVSVLYIGTSGGKVFRLDDPSGTPPPVPPVDISLGAGFPAGGYVSSISVNPRNHDTVLVTFSNYGVTSVFWSGNAKTGTPTTWTAVEGALTLPSYRSSAIAVTAAGVEYFVGTSAGLYNSLGLPGAVAWTQEGPAEMGNALISSIALRTADNQLLIGTHGYGMWQTSLGLPVVPVTLTEFKGILQNKNVLIQWSTSTEVNSKHFELEKSFDGIGFRKIATVPAAGYSNTVKKYSFTDIEKLAEKIYYRLRSIDIDGKEKLSNIVLIKPPGILQDMIILGNPVRNNISIRFVKAPEAAGELRLIDMTGRLVAMQKIAPGEQEIQFILPSGKLSRGVYQLQAEINGRKFIRQILKE